MSKKKLWCMFLCISYLFQINGYAVENVVVNEAREQNQKEISLSDDSELYEFTTETVPSYSSQLAYYESQNYKGGNEEIILSPTKAIFSKGVQSVGDVDGIQKDCIVLEEEEVVEWEFEVKEAGLYTFEVDYLGIGGNESKIQRKLVIDGNVPFAEANNISFYRQFIEAEEIKLNSIGDEVWPKQKEIKLWQTQAIIDNQGFYETPLEFYFSEGKHVVKFEYIDQPIAISEIRIKGKKALQTYEEVKKEYESAGYQSVSQESHISFQAEESASRNDSIIRRESNSDPKTVPFSLTTRVLNTIGGYRWRLGNQGVTWNFEVEEAGLYQLNFKVLQSRDGGMPAYRQILIDGEVPYQELALYKFEFDKDWYGETLASQAGEPYLIYLEPGVHELTLVAKLGPIGKIIEQTTEDVRILSDITREIIKVTGTDPDPNYEYDLYRVMPELSGQLTELADRIENCVGILADISNARTSMENNYRQIVEQLRTFAKDVDLIPKALGDLDTAQSNLGTYITSLEKSPLAIDYIEVASPETEFKVKKSNFIERTWITFVNFLLSFTKDYDSIGAVSEDSEENVVLDVWIARGAEWGEVLKDLADEHFTPETNIAVNVNVLPGGQLSTGSINTLMLSITSGTAPDVALGVDYNLPSEFAFRDAAVDLTQFPEFEEVSRSFYEESFKPYTFCDGIYALPETMDFTVMIYRKDILSELGLELPRTWTELYQDVLPVLYQNSMNFALPVDTSVSSNSPGALRGFTMLLLQNNGDYYREAGKVSDLDSPEAYEAFKMWTELYSNYDIDEESNFFSRMRSGTMPIGIGNYTTYMQFLTSAPELYGRWGVAPVPGLEQEDGSINHSVGTMSSTAAMILNQSDKQEAAWEFLKWWMSEDTQTQYGRELEALIGTSARWNTANTNAFYNLPWNVKDLEIIMAQMEEASEQWIVPGGYFTGRHIINAWNRVILNNENARDSLEEAVKDINKELEAKVKEFGLEDEIIIR